MTHGPADQKNIEFLKSTKTIFVDNIDNTSPSYFANCVVHFLLQQPNRHGITGASGHDNQPLSTPVISLNNLPMPTPADNHTLSTPIFSMATPNLAGAPPSFSSALPSGFPADFALDNTESLAQKLAQYPAAAALPLIQQQALLQQQLNNMGLLHAG